MIITGMTLEETSAEAEAVLQEAGLMGVIDQIKKFFAKFGSSFKDLIDKVKRKTGLASIVDRIANESIAKANAEQQSAGKFTTVTESGADLAILGTVVAASLATGAVASGESFTAYIKNSYKHMKESIAKVDSEKMPEATFALLVLLCVVTIAQIITQVIVMTLGLNPLVSMLLISFITAAVVAPVAEETYKAYAKTYGIYNEAMLLFNILEFSGYVSKMIKSGMNLAVAMFIRLVLVFNHYSMGRQSSTQKVKKNGVSVVPFTSPGVLQHFANNFLAVLITVAQLGIAASKQGA